MLLEVAEELAGGPPKPPNNGFEAGAEVEVDAGVAVVVVAPDRPPNKLEADDGVAEVVAPVVRPPNKLEVDAEAADVGADPNDEVVAGAAVVVEAWVAGVLEVGGKLKVGFDTCGAGVVVGEGVAAEEAGVAEGLPKRPPGVDFGVPLFRPENIEGAFCWVESAGFAPKRGC